MTPTRGLAVVVAVLIATAPAGCGLGAGEAGEGEATLTVTHDYGATDVLETAIPDPRPSDTVIRALDREAEITTRHGGGFVQSIAGVAGSIEEGRSVDWFFYVNGIESPVGSAEVEIEPGDRIWWDHHDWTEVMRVPAVVGAFPQPFEAAGDPGGAPVEVACETADTACDLVGAALGDEGIETTTVAIGESTAGAAPRVLVGTLAAIDSDPAAGLLDAGPARSGVFVRADGEDDELELLDDRVRARQSGAFGLVAAVATGAQAPTWIVTGADDEQVADAAELLGGGSLHNRFALAVSGDGETIPLPVR